MCSVLWESPYPAQSSPYNGAIYQGISMENIDEEVREAAAQQRLQAEHHQENLLERATEKLVETPSPIVEEAREATAQQRLQAEHQQENLLERAEEQVQAST